MTKLLNTYEQADFERLAAFYPYRDEHGLPVLEESLKDYAKRTNQTVNAVNRLTEQPFPSTKKKKTQNVQ